jgi:ABC-type glycerol-3-phosphate transport system substrate-binding protein
MAIRPRAAAIGAALAVLLVAGCGSSSGGGSASLPKITGAAASSVVPWAASGTAPKTTITICLFAGPELDSLRKLAPQFTALSQGKISVNFVPIPTESSNQGTLNQLRSKAATCDLVDQSSTNAGLINQYLEPLDSYMKQPSLFNGSVYNLTDFPAGLLALSKYNGNYVSLPYGSDSPLLMYRADLMKKWGIQVPVAPASWSWDQMLAAIKTIQPKLAAAGMQYPIAVGGVNSVSGAIFALQAMWSYGGNPLQGSTKFNFKDPLAVQGLQQSVDLVHQLHAASPGTSTYDYTELQQALEAGRVPMAIEWNAAAADLDTPAKSPKTAGKMGYAMVPYGGSNAQQPRTFLSTHALAMNKSSKNKNAAFEFMTWYTSPDIAKDYVSTGADSSGRTSLLTNASFAESQPQLKPLGYSLAVAHALPDGPYLPDVLTQVIGPNSNAAYAGTSPVTNAVAKMQTAAESLVQKAGG